MSVRELPVPDHAFVGTVLLCCPSGHSLVDGCYPLRRDRGRPEPFPTRHWLRCPNVSGAIARLEYAGGVRRIEALIAADPDLRARVHADHRTYAAERWSALTPADRDWVTSAGLAPALRETGIGGIRDPDRVKCLHLHWAHHLVTGGSAIGEQIDELADTPIICAR